MKDKLSIANILTSIRIFLSFAILFVPSFSKQFYICYILAGITDMLDGTVARLTGSVSDFGSRLDTAADIIFVAICLFKLIPVIKLDWWVIGWIIIIAIIKLDSMLKAYSRFKKIESPHSIMNKLTGTVLFILPLTITIIDIKYSAVFVCIIATIAAIDERKSYGF